LLTKIGAILADDGPVKSSRLLVTITSLRCHFTPLTNGSSIAPHGSKGLWGKKRLTGAKLEVLKTHRQVISV